MQLSLVIPTLDTDPGKAAILQRCLDSLTPLVDEVIIIDSKTDSLAKKINDGLKKAKGDFIIVSNDDLFMNDEHQSLRELCHEGEVDVPVLHGGIDKLFHGHMWCIPRAVYEEIGGYDETCPGPYHIDSDYFMRLLNSPYPIVKNSNVHIAHPEPGRTLKQLASSNNMGDTEAWFIKKWGRDALRTIQ
jgi:glycosyltransferase involved in cell wall biosynthesis